MKKVLAAGAASALVTVVFACQHPFANCFEGCVNETVRRVCFTTQADETFDGDEKACPDGTKCVENYRSNGDPYAACTAGGIDKDCDRDEDITFCDGNSWVRCKGHYREDTVDCRDGVCAELENVAKCVRSLEPDPHCSGDAGALTTQATFCEGDTLFGCFGPYAGIRRDCATDGKFCRVLAGSADCRLQSEPDPRCDDTKQPFDMYCDGEVIVKCRLGWREATFDCREQGRRCVSSPRTESNVPNVRCE